MKKSVLLLTLAGLVAGLFAFGACAPKFTNEYYPLSKIDELFVKTKTLTDYNVKYKLDKSVALKNADDGLNTVIYEDLYNIDATLKKHKDASDEFAKYSFIGTKHEIKHGTGGPRPGTSSEQTNEFEQHNAEKGKMICSVDGAYSRTDTFNDSTYGKIDKLSDAFYSETNVERILIYDMPMSSDKNYLFQYAYDNDEKKTTVPQSLFNPFGTYPLPTTYSTFTVKACQAEMIFNKDGYLMKQIVKIEMDLSEGTYNGYNILGTAKLELTVEYIKPWETVKL